MCSINIIQNGSLFKSLMAATLLMATGCNKILEIDRPRNTISTETTFDSDGNANAALAGMYTWMMDGENGSPTVSNGGLSVYAALLSDEVENRIGNLNPIDEELNVNKIAANNEGVFDVLWRRPYKAIYSANAILEGVASSTSPRFTDTTRKQLAAEAKLARGFLHFYLVNLFGDVPLMTSTDVTKTANLQRTPVAEVYKQIEQDLKDAFLDLRDNYSVSGGEKVRPNKWAAAAMLARVYLYQQKWAEAEEQANLVIGSTKYQTQAPGDVFKPNSAESIWQLRHNEVYEAGQTLVEPRLFVPMYRYNWLPPDYQILFLDPSFYEVVSAFMLPNYTIRQSLLDAFETDDQRKVKWIDANPTPNAAPYNGVVHSFPAKYDGLNPDLSTYAPGYYTVLRISEQYLIRAEAKARQGTDLSGAADDINQIRNKNGLGNTDAATAEQLLDAILKERRIEFMAEWGHRWFDLKRFGKASSVLGAIATKQPWSENKLLMPIPSQEIQKNPRLTPNPGY